MVTFRVPDMTCGHCASNIARAIASVDKGARIEVNVADRLVMVTGTADQVELAEAISDAGYKLQAVEEPIQQRPTGRGCCCG